MGPGTTELSNWEYVPDWRTCRSRTDFSARFSDVLSPPPTPVQDNWEGKAWEDAEYRFASARPPDFKESPPYFRPRWSIRSSIPISGKTDADRTTGSSRHSNIRYSGAGNGSGMVSPCRARTNCRALARHRLGYPMESRRSFRLGPVVVVLGGWLTNTANVVAQTPDLEPRVAKPLSVAVEQPPTSNPPCRPRSPPKDLAVQDPRADRCGGHHGEPGRKEQGNLRQLPERRRVPPTAPGGRGNGRHAGPLGGRTRLRGGQRRGEECLRRDSLVAGPGGSADRSPGRAVQPRRADVQQVVPVHRAVPRERPQPGPELGCRVPHLRAGRTVHPPGGGVLDGHRQRRQRHR